MSGSRSGKADPSPFPGAVPQLGATEPGKPAVPDPSPWAGQRIEVRMRRLVGLLEAAAAAGSLQATRDALAYHRWSQEMRKGRPPQRHQLQADVAVHVVDSVTALPADQAAELRRLVSDAGAGRTIGQLPGGRSVAAGAQLDADQDDPLASA
jgi:hypothetical protein